VHIEDLAGGRGRAVKVGDKVLVGLGFLEPLLLVSDLFVLAVALRAPLLYGGDRKKGRGRIGERYACRQRDAAGG
jgi:hypothetical protein